jgi:hypothetical protein
MAVVCSAVLGTILTPLVPNVQRVINRLGSTRQLIVIGEGRHVYLIDDTNTKSTIDLYSTQLN